MQEIQQFIADLARGAAYWHKFNDPSDATFAAVREKCFCVTDSQSSRQAKESRSDRYEKVVEYLKGTGKLEELENLPNTFGKDFQRLVKLASRWRYENGLKRAARRKRYYAEPEVRRRRNLARQVQADNLTDGYVIDRILYGFKGEQRQEFRKIITPGLVEVERLKIKILRKAKSA